MTDTCPTCGGAWSRWCKLQDRKDHRQYRFCLSCYHKVFRQPPKRLRDRVKKEWRKDIFSIDAQEWREE